MNQIQDNILQFRLTPSQLQVLTEKMPSKYSLVVYKPQYKRVVEQRQQVFIPSSPSNIRQTRKKNNNYQKFFMDNSGVPRNLSDQMKKCYMFLQNLMNLSQAEPFLKPVDWKLLKLFDYPKIIKEPMDFMEIERKLVENKYQNRLDFAKDIRLIWKNAMTFNAPNTPVYNMAAEMSQIFEQRFKEKILTEKQLQELKQIEFNNKLVQMQTTIKSLFNQENKYTQSVQQDDPYENYQDIPEQLQKVFEINPRYQIELYQLLKNEQIQEPRQEAIDLSKLNDHQKYKKLSCKEKNENLRTQKKHERQIKIQEKIKNHETQLQQIQEIDKLNEINQVIADLNQKLENDISEQSIISENSSDYFDEIK